MLWCEGQPERERRPLRPEERAWICLLRRRATLKAAGAVALGLLGLGAMPLVALLAELDLLERVPDAVPAAFAVAGLALGVPVALLLLRDAVGSYRALGRGMRAGEAVVFGRGETERVVLGEEGLLLSRGGRACARARRTDLLDAEPAPEAAGGPVTVRLDDAWSERPLTLAEREELAVRAQRLGRPHWLLWLWTAMLVFAVARHVAGDRWRPAWFVGVGAIALLWWRVGSDRRLRKRLEADAARGVVCSGRDEEYVAVEVLPTSGMLWSAQGAPAPWRTARRRS